MIKHQNYLIVLLIFINIQVVKGQSYISTLDSLEKEILKLDKKKEDLSEKINKIKLNKIQIELKKKGLPENKQKKQIIHHSSFSLSYNEDHEQANWVAHIISPDINKPGFSRTNDFRIDPLISTGSAAEEDYFIKHLLDDGTYKYDGYGYDRGHLAPSADFRWCLPAMSETYYYSNISPQLPEFNRGIWAELESLIREYVQDKNRKVFVVTGPLIKDNLKKIERSTNNLSIPEEFFKVVIDIDGNTPYGIGFLIPHQKCDYPVMSYTLTIDEIENKTGINFFASLPDEVENTIESDNNFKHWQTGLRKFNVIPIHRNKLPENSVNTVQARSYYDSKTKVCGTVVEVHETKAGHYFINFDQDFPEQLFWCTIWKDNIVNFSYDPQKYLINKKICVKGVIKKKYDKPSMSIYNEEAITIYEDEILKKKGKN